MSMYMCMGLYGEHPAGDGGGGGGEGGGVWLVRAIHHVQWHRYIQSLRFLASLL